MKKHELWVNVSEMKDNGFNNAGVGLRVDGYVSENSTFA